MSTGDGRHMITTEGSVGKLKNSYLGRKIVYRAFISIRARSIWVNSCKDNTWEAPVLAVRFLKQYS